MTQRIVVLGAGFAGLWAAAAAARRLDGLGVGPDRVEVVVLNRTPFHAIRVRNYELDVAETLVPLESVLAPIGVRSVVATVTRIDPARRTVHFDGEGGPGHLAYDRLIVALGSRMMRLPIPGLAEAGFDVDTAEGAAALQAHLAALDPGRAGADTAVVIGAGLTGVETAAELAGRPGVPARVVLVDRADRVGSDMGPAACDVIGEAVQALGIERRTRATVVSVDRGGVVLADGERIAAATVIACVAMQAHPATADLGAPLDARARLLVEPTLQIAGRPEFAAGDAASFLIDGVHPTVMSCQHARPMGRFAGHNAVGDLLGLEMLPLDIDWYVTVLDLGRWGALYTEGWDRQVVSTGAEAKKTKMTINRERIYPPRSGRREDIFAAAAPVVQRPPLRRMSQASDAA